MEPTFGADSEPTIEPDRRVAVAVFVLLGLLVVAAFVANQYLPPLVGEWLQRRNAAAPARAAVHAFTVFLPMLLVAAFFFLTYAGWAWLMAARIFRSAHFPPPGYLVLVRTRVLNGAAARRKAVQFIIGGVVSIGLLAYLVWTMFQFAPPEQLLRGLGG